MRPAPSQTTPAAGPLAGLKVLEFSAIGPVPWGVSLLADMAAQITRVCRPQPGQPSKAADTLSERGRRDVHLDLKSGADQAQVRALIAEHDVLIEGMRPGVMERLGLGPADCHALNPQLVYVRVTGWGQDGPLALRAGHDINYIALSGALHAIGPRDGPPTIPLNLVGDYGGGGTFMVIGLLAALLRARSSGQGCVVDAAMLDGAVRQSGVVYERLAQGSWRDQRGVNMLDGGTPWYSVYQTACGGYMAVGAIEPQFYRVFVQALGLDEAALPSRDDPANWDALRQRFTQCFLARTRAHWSAVFEPLDACVSPVLSLSEAPLHPHNQARAVFTTAADGSHRAGLAPRFAPLRD